MTKKKEIKFKRISNKSVAVRKSELVEKKSFKKNSRIRSFLAKLIGVKESGEFRFVMRIKYSGGKLVRKDVVTDSEGNIYTVLKESNHIALLLNYKPMAVKPVIKGRLQIHSRVTK